MKYLLTTLLAASFTCSCTKTKNKSTELVYSTVPVREGALTDKQTWDGTVRASTRIELRTNRKVKIGKVLVREGEAVKKGQLIIEVDTTEDKKKIQDLSDRIAAASIDLKSTSLSLDFAKRISERKSKLSKRGIIAQKEQDEANKQLETAQSQKKSKNLEYAKLKREFEQASKDSNTAHFYAPIDGIVTNLVKADPYTELRPGQIVGVVSDPKKLAFYTEIEEGRVQRLKTGNAVTVVLDALPNTALPGKVSEINLSGSETQNTSQPVNKYMVKIEFKAPNEKIRDGFQGKSEIVFAQKPKTLAAPLEAVRYNAGKPFLLVASSKGAEPKPSPVQLGILTSEEAEILAGAAAKQLVVLEVK